MRASIKERELRVHEPGTAVVDDDEIVVCKGLGSIAQHSCVSMFCED